ncbi:hypothetical protein BpHYR1_037214 [Brachionus plicatilis]|uniref:Uncharacterized protein n=1 Tax=Brachionus plicatilis TaxID=10195 RepID=A0A3M7PLG4_BRAPC|nr:hypothetical protein BpHYR1_037214 [Brachionus plicatilis]
MIPIKKGKLKLSHNCSSSIGYQASHTIGTAEKKNKSLNYNLAGYLSVCIKFKYLNYRLNKTRALARYRYTNKWSPALLHLVLDRSLVLYIWCQELDYVCKYF